MKRALGWLVAAAVPLGLVVALVRSGLAELRPPRGAASASVYDPLSYYDLVNREIAPHLELCPLYPDPTTAARGEPPPGIDDVSDGEVPGKRAVGSAAPSPAEAPCSCGDRRLSALFCLQNDPGVDGDRIRRYLRMSPLLDDLSIRARWRIGGADERRPGEGDSRPVVRLIEGEHRQHLPGGDVRPRYDGTIYYRPTGPHVVLVDAGGNEHILGGSPSRAVAAPPPVPRATKRSAKGTSPAASVVAAPPELALDAWLRDQQRALDEGSPSRSFHPGDTLRLRHEHELVTLHVARDAGAPFLVVVVHETRGALRVSVDGAPLRAQERRTILGIHPQEQLQLRWGSEPPLELRLVSDRSAVLSEVRFSTAGSERVFDEASGVSDYLRAFVGALTDAADKLGDGYRECQRAAESAPGVGDLPNIEPLARADVWLTLDQVLQGAAERSLARYAESGPPARAPLGLRRGAWRDGEQLVPPPHLTLLVLDADRGDVLATASYPDAPALRRLTTAALREASGPVALVGEDLAAEARRTSLHLRPHLIGSLWKPLFAWSAGEADPRLIDFTIPLGHPTTWLAAGAGVRNRVLDQCLIDGRRDEKTHELHFARAYAPPRFFASCDGRAAGEEDLCLALAASDTYYFLELGARVMAAEHGTPLPPPGTPAAARDYDLRAMCASQHVQLDDGRKVEICKDESPHHMARWFPATCPPGARDPLCVMSQRLDVRLQPIGDQRAPGGAASFLGPLDELVRRLGRPLEGDECKELGVWQRESLSGFRWLVPLETEWPSDLVDSCAPDYEMFIEGARLNYWDNFHLAQAMARLLSGDDRLRTRLVAKVGRADAPDEGELAPPPHGAPATGTIAAPPSSARAVAESCRLAPASPRCRVLEGLRLAVEKGTLRRLAGVAEWLSRPSPGQRPLAVSLWGKTGTSRDVYPTYVARARQEGPVWVRDTTFRKSLNTALLVEVRSPDGERARHFVVHVWGEGLDDSFTASDGLVPMFERAQPGGELLRELVGYVAAEGEGAGEAGAPGSRPGGAQ